MVHFSHQLPTIEEIISLKHHFLTQSDVPWNLSLFSDQAADKFYEQIIDTESYSARLKSNSKYLPAVIGLHVVFRLETWEVACILHTLECPFLLAFRKPFLEFRSSVSVYSMLGTQALKIIRPITAHHDTIQHRYPPLEPFKVCSKCLFHSIESRNFIL
jgi:hypothetical protein